MRSCSQLRKSHDGYQQLVTECSLARIAFTFSQIFMASLPRPPKPLKILTIDGGGLQGISTLLILEELLRAIARNNGCATSKPRPCDVFDVITGIGPGGWLALLLGRFQMDIPSALAEWYNLIDCIAPRSKREKLRMRLKQHSYYDTERLIEQIDQLTEEYEIDKHMFLAPPEDVRCKHVFVSALRTGSKDSHLGYNLFRTYDCPEGADLLDGPTDPRTYSISHAFAATGAAKYFTPPWKEKKGKVKFQDTQFPSPHNITELALNEVWGLYGKDVEISVVVNIGPGSPDARDCERIARRFSWGRRPAVPKRRRSSGNYKSNNSFKRVKSNDYEPAHEKPSIPQENFRNPPRVTLESISPRASRDAERNPSVARHTTFGSERNVVMEEKLKRDESQIEKDIRKKLKNVYPNNPPPYYRLAPERSAPGSALNDTSSPKASFDSTRLYLKTAHVNASIDELSHHVRLEAPVTLVVAAA